tara:strand:+ start:64 stop:855 length:792 start_codon:yes stop_codon:yes gene_type:complete
MSNWKLRAAPFGCVAASLLAWVGWDLSVARGREEKAKRLKAYGGVLQPQASFFAPGSTDEMIMDSLEAGDVLLFKRRCEMVRSLAGAARCMLRRQRQQQQRDAATSADPSSGGASIARFDHCAIVVIDPSGSTVPHILERCGSGDGRRSLRRYDTRILCSASEEIFVRRLQVERTPALRSAVARAAAALLAEKDGGAVGSDASAADASAATVAALLRIVLPAVVVVGGGAAAAGATCTVADLERLEGAGGAPLLGDAEVIRLS